MKDKERINTTKTNTINIVHCSKCHYTLSYYLHVTNALIIPMIFNFLPCRGKAHDDKKFSRENSKPRRESRITTR